MLDSHDVKDRVDCNKKKKKKKNSFREVTNFAKVITLPLFAKNCYLPLFWTCLCFGVGRNTKFSSNYNVISFNSSNI